jgi:Ca-activated chloride channel family protein
LVGADWQSARTNLPHIQVDVNLVNLGFTVRDARGALAADLSRDDFEVFEDGVPQASPSLHAAWMCR